jgi:hypothetical protein
MTTIVCEFEGPLSEVQVGFNAKVPGYPLGIAFLFSSIFLFFASSTQSAKSELLQGRRK